MKMRGIRWLSILLVLVLLGTLGGAFAVEYPAASEEVEPAAAETATPDAEEPAAPAYVPAMPVLPAADGDAEDSEVEYGYLILNTGYYGYYEYPWQTEVQIEVVKGSHFTAETPTAISDAFLFEGWYTGVQGKGERITGETVIGDELRAYGCWRPNPAAIPVMELNAVYPLEITSFGEFFAFTPSETASYDIYTADNDPYEGTAVIQLLDDKLNHIAYSSMMDHDLNAIISMELTAGTTYYIKFDDEAEIVVTEPIDVYAVAHYYKEVVLDANGGKYPEWAKDDTKYYYRYTPGEIFAPPYNPSIDDSERAFAGWATTEDAVEPDIIEYMEYEDLGDVLYAVYTETVTVTFDANGGYLNGNPDLKTRQLTYGKGHIFYVPHAEYDDPYTEIMGWMDQNGVIVPHTTMNDPGYQYMEDSYMTALWGRYLVVDANGGCFRFNADLIRMELLFPTYKPFSNDRVIELAGEPINFDDTKYLAGWATDPDAEEPDVIEGETDVVGLRYIFAIWKDDTYYIAEGEDQTWEKGSTDGLRVVVKRTGDDTMTFSCFRGVTVDGEQPDFTRDEGSLILTLPASYLETLDAGEHELRISFTEDVTVETAFTVTEPEGSSDKDKDKDKDPDKDKDSDKSGSDTDKNKSSDKKTDSNTKNSTKSPKTGDRNDILPWIALLGLSSAGLAAAAFSAGRKRKTARSSK